MRIAEYEIFRYDLPLRDSIRINNIRIESRSGFLLRISDGHGYSGFGEVAPLPGLHKEGLDEALKSLYETASFLESRDVPPNLEKLENGFQNWIGKEFLHPSVRFGLEMAILNLLAEHSNQSLAGVLSKRWQKTVRINGLLLGEKEDVPEYGQELVEDGCRVIKMKVGRMPVEEEIRIVNRLYEIITEKWQLRLDANRRWSNKDALEFVKSVGGDNIEYVEEPLADPTGLSDFFDQTGLPIALDESLDEIPLDQLENIKGLRAFVIKPSVIGGFERSMKLVRYGNARGIYPVVSSAFESGLGLSALVNFAASLNPGSTAMGLDTNRWFAKDVLESGFKIADGKLDVELAYHQSKKINYRLLKKITSN